MNKIILFAALFIAIQAAHAQEDTDLKALQLADQISTTTEKASNWHSFIETSLGGSTLRATNSFQPEQRLSLDVQYDNSFATGWRAVFANRLDLDWPASPPMSNAINTIKEAYLSWQVEPDLLFDAGRINVRNGVSAAYNPTDYFKEDAVRSMVSIDPKSLKENRQGSVMVRAQKLFNTSSLTVLYSPKLATHTNEATFNPDIAATNNQHRWLLSYSHKISEGFSPQLLLFKSEQLPTQFGFNLSYLLNTATVFNLEWSGGRSASLLTRSLQEQGISAADDSRFRQHLTSGMTYTTQNKISLTAEFEFHGAGLSQHQWDTLPRFPLAYGVYRNYLLTTQESPTQRTLFLYGTWEDALINDLDLTVLGRHNLVDSSQIAWTELRYHFPKADIALQWQRYSGSRFSEFGANSQMQSWALVGRYYF